MRNFQNANVCTRHTERNLHENNRIQVGQLEDAPSDKRSDV